MKPNYIKAILLIVVTFSFALISTAQIKTSLINNSTTKINPLLLIAFKKPINTNPLLAQSVKPGKHELMYWPAYNLTAEEIEYRDKNLNRSVGGQIAHDIINSYITTMLYGKKATVAVKPGF